MSELSTYQVLCGISIAMMIVLALVLYILVCIFRLMHWYKRRHPKSVVPVANSQVYNTQYY